MPDYSSLLGMMGYEATTLPGLFGQYFEDPEERWSQYLEPSFGLAQEALGELPGLRGGMLGQLRGGLQERSVAAGRGLQARRAGAGFAGSGAIERLGRTARRGLQQEYGRGMWDIGQDIARKEAGILGTLSGKVGGFLERLMAADVTPAGAGEDGFGGIGTGEAGLGGDVGLGEFTNPLMILSEWQSEIEDSDPGHFEGMDWDEIRAEYAQYKEWWEGGR